MSYTLRFSGYRFSGAVLSLALFGILGVATASAGTLAITVPGSGLTTDWGIGSPVNLGTVFTANANFSVDSLGFYYGNQASVTSSEEVGLYDGSGNLLASAWVSPAGPQTDGFVFQSIAPVALTAGQTYTVDAFVGLNGWAWGPVPATDPRVTWDNSTYVYTGALTFPTASYFGTTESYYGANFTMTGSAVVPEPGSFALLGGGLLVLGGALKRGRRK
jgi:hypothetical protein